MAAKDLRRSCARRPGSAWALLSGTLKWPAGRARHAPADLVRAGVARRSGTPAPGFVVCLRPDAEPLARPGKTSRSTILQSTCEPLNVSFVIESWAACAPGLDTPQRWSQWAAAPWLPEGEPLAALAAVPPMQRRRFAPLGRLAAQAAFDLRGTAPAAEAPQAADDVATVDDVPTVFASRYGETTRCLDLLQAQVRGEALSPTAFALSVHNAMGAMIAIVREDRSNSSAIAAGRMTAAAGVTEAVALLADGAEAVDLIVYDAPLPRDYTQFEDEPMAHFAWAWRVRRPRAGERAIRLEWLGGDADADAAADRRAAALPASLQAMWFALSDAPTLEQAGPGRRCRWSRVE